MLFLATAVPGLHPVVVREVAARMAGRVHSEHEFDGRNDVVSFNAAADPAVLSLRTTEDVFVQVSTATRRAGGLRTVVNGLCDDFGLTRALSVYASLVRPLRARMTFRVVARVRSETDFRRTALRDELTRRIGQLRPRWRMGDPAEIELWATESTPGQFRLAVRLTSRSMRHRGGRVVERHGALRPTVAAAMVLLAGEPDADAPLLDPCCGTRTILVEADMAAWRTAGSDFDAEAVRAARRNVDKSVDLLVADVRRLPFGRGSVAAVTSNLPFGKQYDVQGPVGPWLTNALRELVRVTRPGARVVLLTPPTRAFHHALGEAPELKLEERFGLRLFGMPTTLWSLKRC